MCIYELLLVYELPCICVWIFENPVMCLDPQMDFFQPGITCGQSDVSLLLINHRELSEANQMSSLLSANPQERTPRAPLSAKLLM